MILNHVCHHLRAGLNRNSRHIFKLPPSAGQDAVLRTSAFTVRSYHHRVPMVPPEVNKTLRKKYELTDDYFVIYKEPKAEFSQMIILKYLELFTYCTPFLGSLYYFLWDKETGLSFLAGHNDFYYAVAIICLYLPMIRFFANSYVKIMFHNRKDDIYRAYVLNKYWPTFKFVEFKAEDLRVINLPPSIPFAQYFFRAGKQNFLFHDSLFLSYSEQERLTSTAISLWLARWGK